MRTGLVERNNRLCVVDEKNAAFQEFGPQQWQAAFIGDDLRGDEVAKPIDVANVRFERHSCSIRQDGVCRGLLSKPKFVDECLGKDKATVERSVYPDRYLLGRVSLIATYFDFQKCADCFVNLPPQCAIPPKWIAAL